jgi:hypothetical protein
MEILTADKITDALTSTVEAHPFRRNSCDCDDGRNCIGFGCETLVGGVLDTLGIEIPVAVNNMAFTSDEMIYALVAQNTIIEPAGLELLDNISNADWGAAWRVKPDMEYPTLDEKTPTWKRQYNFLMSVEGDDETENPSQ